MTHYQMNGKEGLLLTHQGKIVFGEVVDGRIGERMEWDSYPVVAVGFLAYCCFNEPQDNGGDIYTPYFDKYYKACKEQFRRKNIGDIELIRDQEKLESEFYKKHVEEERQSFEKSKSLFDFLSSEEGERHKNLYKAYMDYLGEKQNAKFTPLSDMLDSYLSSLQSSMYTEKIIDTLPFDEFVSSVYRADFKKMFDFAKKNRNQNRFIIIINRIKTWFPAQWIDKAAESMEMTVVRMSKVTINEDLQTTRKKWCNDLDKIIPKFKDMQ